MIVSYIHAYIFFPKKKCSIILSWWISGCLFSKTDQKEDINDTFTRRQRQICCHLAWFHLAHPSLESTGEDEHINGGGGVHRSTNKTGGRDDKGDSKGSGRHLCYLALSPLESIGAGSRQLCCEFLEEMLANSCQWPHSAEIPYLDWMLVLQWKMKLDCCKKGGWWMLCLVENDSGPTCLRGNPKAPATTTIRHRVLYQYNNWVQMRCVYFGTGASRIMSSKKLF